MLYQSLEQVEALLVARQIKHSPLLSLLHSWESRGETSVEQKSLGEACTSILHPRGTVRPFLPQQCWNSLVVVSVSQVSRGESVPGHTADHRDTPAP